MFKQQFRPALVLFAALAVLCGLVYPAIVTGLAQLALPHQSSGSLIVRDGRPVASELIGQSFSDPSDFWGRLSATAGQPYNGMASGGSNLAATNPTLIEHAQARLQALRNADPGNTQPVPVELVTASASGLDSHVSPAAAQYQAARVARARGLSAQQVRQLVEAHTEPRTFGFLGEPRVNVLKLNLALGALKPALEDTPHAATGVRR